MIAVCSLLSHFAGVISGFDLADEIDLRSLGFGSSSSRHFLEARGLQDRRQGTGR